MLFALGCGRQQNVAAPAAAPETVQQPAALPNASGAAPEAASPNAASSDIYYMARADTRACEAPKCRGYFVRALNRPMLACAGGKLVAECYVAYLNVTALKLSAREAREVQTVFGQGRSIIRGRMAAAPTYGDELQLIASDAWYGASGAKPEGQFYRLNDAPARCTKEPCAVRRVRELNTEKSVDDRKVDLKSVNVDESLREDAAVFSIGKKGILFAGFPDRVSEFYTPVEHTEGASCGSHRGTICNGDQFCAFSLAAECGAVDVPGRCEYRPEICTKELKQVCACNGRTYGNACLAAMAGESVAEEQPCKSR